MTIKRKIGMLVPLVLALLAWTLAFASPASAMVEPPAEEEAPPNDDSDGFVTLGGLPVQVTEADGVRYFGATKSVTAQPKEGSSLALSHASGSSTREVYFNNVLSANAGRAKWVRHYFAITQRVSGSGPYRAEAHATLIDGDSYEGKQVFSGYTHSCATVNVVNRTEPPWLPRSSRLRRATSGSRSQVTPTTAATTALSTRALLANWTLCGQLRAAEPMQSRYLVLRWLAGLLLIGGCSGGIQDGSPRHTDVSVAPTVSLEDGIKTLSVADAALIHDGLAGETPQGLPSHALAVGFFGVGEFDDPPRRPSELVVANYWSTPLRMNVICLADGVQVSCSQDAGVWRVELDEPGLAVLALPESGARRDVILAEERDHMVKRHYPISYVRPVDGWDVSVSTLSDPPRTITNPLGGCDWALLMDNLDPRETFKPLRTKGDEAVHLVMSTCPGNASYEMRPLIVLDDTVVAQIDTFQPFVAQPGITYALKIPDELFGTARAIRGAVVRRAPTSGHWTTHPLFTATNPLP